MVAMDPKRAKTARGRRALEKMAPKLIENPRTALVLRGQKTSATVNAALADIYMLKKPLSKHFSRHNAVQPFEDATALEFLCQKNDASLFAMGTHSKKRPNNLVLGRMFDHHILDMVELGIDKFKSMAEFAAESAGLAGGCAAESKPCLLFQGAEWDHSSSMDALRQLLVDFFNLRVVESISPLGLEHVLVFTAVAEGRVMMRHYLTKLLRSAEGKVPHVELEEMGPSLDLTVRRSSPAAPDTMRAAMVRPKAMAQAPKKEKNVTRSKLLGKRGRLHMPKQDLSKMATARMKAYRAPDKDGKSRS